MDQEGSSRVSQAPSDANWFDTDQSRKWLRSFNGCVSIFSLGGRTKSQLHFRSDPASPNFGKHWTSEKVIKTFRPSQKTENEVREWLIENGISKSRITHSDNKGWFAFYATAE